MRRLAKQSREDVYSSRRDYQRLEEGRGVRFEVDGQDDRTLAFDLALGKGHQGLAGFGGYIAPSKATDVRIAIRFENGEVIEREFSLSPVWNRFGLAIRGEGPAQGRIEWATDAELCLWGVTGGVVELPDVLAERELGEKEFLRDHLVPETFYFEHGGALELDVLAEESSPFSTDDGLPVTLKKCAYCGRRLPVDPKRLGALAFHKHNAKLTLHQNECRACKKWRINDSFNPIRTTDQLHESSVITRERRTFLRDPEILQTIKDRTGAGLKTQVWERFGKTCFYCRKELTIDQVHLDHTRPLAYLWPIDAHATCLCADHNNQKQDKFPVDFYSEDQLVELSAISGLPLDDLRKKEVNEVELNRILLDLPVFAREWDPRHFAATARKVGELRPGIDLFELLREADEKAHSDLTSRLRERPLPVGFEMSNEA